jgi:hypothetical protein
MLYEKLKLGYTKISLISLIYSYVPRSPACNDLHFGQVMGVREANSYVFTPKAYYLDLRSCGRGLFCAQLFWF